MTRIPKRHNLMLRTGAALQKNHIQHLQYILKMPSGNYIELSPNLACQQHSLGSAEASAKTSTDYEVSSKSLMWVAGFFLFLLFQFLSFRFLIPQRIEILKSILKGEKKNLGTMTAWIWYSSEIPGQILILGFNSRMRGINAHNASWYSSSWVSKRS